MTVRPAFMTASQLADQIKLALFTSNREALHVHGDPHPTVAAVTSKRPTFNVRHGMCQKQAK